MIRFNDLEVRYPGAPAPALRGMSLALAPGIVGLLGPNGAGKSTLLKTLLGLLAPAKGQGEVLGVALGSPEATRLRARIGYMPEYDALIEDASAYHQVAFWGELSGLSPQSARDRAHEVLHFVGLGEARYRAASGFSTGMRQRVKLAQAIVHSPDLVFLDEPTNGLDPDGRRRMLDIVLRVREELGTTVVLASHLLEDVERVADQLVILDQGTVKASGPMAALRRLLAKRYELRFLDPLDSAQEAALAELGRILTHRHGVYDMELPEADALAPFHWAQAQGATLVQMTPRHDRLDEMLLRALKGDFANMVEGGPPAPEGRSASPLDLPRMPAGQSPANTPTARV